MKLTYAIGDIHGCASLLKKILKEINIHRDKNKAEATVVFLGDYIDRGPSSKQVCDILMSKPEYDHTTHVILQGNHEEMCLVAHEQEEHMGWWVSNGGETTLNSFNGRCPDEYLKWMGSLPTYYKDEYRLYVHAGIVPNISIDRQDEDHMRWIRWNEYVETPNPENLYVVHGHTPFKHGPIILNTRCNLDVMAYKTNKMSVAIFNDNVAGKPTDMIEVEL